MWRPHSPIENREGGNPLSLLYPQLLQLLIFVDLLDSHTPVVEVFFISISCVCIDKFLNPFMMLTSFFKHLMSKFLFPSLVLY